jgi:hypothetical protein
LPRWHCAAWERWAACAPQPAHGVRSDENTARSLGVIAQNGRGKFDKIVQKQKMMDLPC